MEITPSEILFSKPQFTVFDEAFSRLSQVINDRRMVSYQVLLELLEHLQFDLARINEVGFCKIRCCCCLQTKSSFFLRSCFIS